MTPGLADGNSSKYKVAGTPPIPEAGATCTTGYTAWDGTSEIQAAAGQKIVVVEVDASNKCVGAGEAVIVSAE